MRDAKGDRSTLFLPAKKMLRWGKKDILKFEGRTKAFVKREPYRRVTDLDAERGQHVLKLVRDKDIPDVLEEIATRSLLNIKHCFDRALYAACRTLEVQTKGSVNFPWADSPNGCKGMLDSKNSQVPPKLRPEIMRLEPYGTGEGHAGGDDISRQLAKIANRKHTVDLGMLVTFSAVTQDVTIKNPQFFDTPFIQPWEAMGDEIVMARYSKDTEYYYRYSAQVHICFDEPGSLKGVPVAEALAHFAAKAQTVIEALEAEARRLKNL